MDFFLPCADSQEQAEEALKEIAKNKKLAIPNPRIHKLEYLHNGHMMKAEVGCKVNSYYELPEGDQVFAILSSGMAYAICTYSRGIMGDPIYVGTDSVRKATHFD